MRPEATPPPCGWCGSHEYGKGPVILELQKRNDAGTEGIRTQCEALVCAGCGRVEVFVKHPRELVRGGWLAPVGAKSPAPYR